VIKIRGHYLSIYYFFAVFAVFEAFGAIVWYKKNNKAHEPQQADL